MAEQSALVGLAAPIERAGRYAFGAGDLLLEVDPNAGGRVTVFAIAGKNLLIGPEIDPKNYGSTFWTSPQSDWGWPPIAEIDNLPYAARVVGSTLVLTGPTSRQLGVSVTKIFTVDAETASARIEYIVHNRGNAPCMLAPWEVSRVRVDGLTFFPTGEGEYRYAAVPLRTQDAAGMTWFDYRAASIETDSKFFADGRRGLLFHVTSEAVLFVKRFADAPAAERAPGQGEIEIYANAAHTYVELENQGPYRAIAPGESLSYRVDWFLRELPPGIEAKLGNPALIEFAESIVRQS